MRRILTAREQVELLSPWRTAEYYDDEYDDEPGPDYPGPEQYSTESHEKGYQGNDGRGRIFYPYLPDKVNPRPKDRARPGLEWYRRPDEQQALPGMEDGPQGFDTTTLHRGLTINLEHPGAEKIRNILFPPDHPSWDEMVPPQEPKQPGLFGDDRHEDPSSLGHAILDYLDSYHDERRNSPNHGNNPWPWLGRHWSTDPDVATVKKDMGGGFGDIGYQSDPDHTIGVHLQGEWDGRGEDPRRAGTGGSIDHEQEVTLLPGAPINITHVNVQHPDDPDFWENTLSSPSQRTASPWKSKEGDPTYSVPTGDLLRHRQFNPAIQTPEQMHDALWTMPWEHGQPYRNNFDRNFSSGGGSQGSQNEDDIVDAFEKGHKLPPTEIVTNGYGATLSDGNHRAEVADMMSHPALDSYIHYDPHQPDSFYKKPVDPDSELGKHIDTLVQNYPYEPVDGGPSTDHVFRKHPETGRWQRGVVDHSSPPQFVDTPEYAKQMQQSVPGYKHDGLGTYFDVDFGNGPEITHERHLYANLESWYT